MLFVQSNLQVRGYIAGQHGKPVTQRLQKRDRQAFVRRWQDEESGMSIQFAQREPGLEARQNRARGCIASAATSAV